MSELCDLFSFSIHNIDKVDISDISVNLVFQFERDY